MSPLRALALLAIAVSLGHAAAQAPAPAGAAAAKPQRLALVIGNGSYRDAPLANPLNDAEDVAKALEASGFKVLRHKNATLKEMHLALREFGDQLGRQTTGLFYFAGHGMQVRGRNYLIPVDADVAREDEVAYSALDLGAVMEKLDSAKNAVNLVILDACRNNPFGTRLQASAKGLAQVEAPPGTLIAFSTAPGSTAADGGGRNGLYTQHLVQEMQKPGLAIEEVFKATRAGVRADSRGAQIPWESTSLESRFAFREAPAEKPALAMAQQQAPGRGQGRARSAVAASAPPAFAVGDHWVYRIVNQIDRTERQGNMRVKEIHGDEVHYQNGNVGDLVGNYSRIVRGENRVEVFDPSNQFYIFPMKVGAKWNQEALQKVGERVFDLKVKVAVTAEEDVETPAGKFHALRLVREVHWKQRNRDNAGVNTFTYWYNGGVKRFVLAEGRNVTTSGKVLLDERQELASYAVK